MEDSSIFWCSINFAVIVIEQSFLYYLEENKLLKHYVVSVTLRSSISWPMRKLIRNSLGRRCAGSLRRFASVPF